MAADGSYIPANVSRESWINVEIEVEQSMQSYLDSLDEELSNQPGFKKPPTKIAVSYTHLDVYKRQVLIGAVANIVLDPIFIYGLHKIG